MDHALHSRDIVVALKLALWQEDFQPTMRALAQRLDMHHGDISRSIQRLSFAGLYNVPMHRVLRENLLEFLLHGVRYAFPAVVDRASRPVRGVSTVFSAEALRSVVVGVEDLLVWPDPDGSAMGRAVQPLWKSVPFVASQDPAFHECMALLDGLRVGRVRERQLATRALREKLS